MSTEIQEYSATEAALSVLREKYGGKLWAAAPAGKMAVAKEARAEIRKWRLDLEAERKRIKAPALETCKAIDSEAKRITVELLTLEKPVDDAIKEVEQAAKREKARQEREEAERIAKARAEIDRIRNVPVGLVGADLKAIHSASEGLKNLNLSWTAEFSGVARAARDEAISKLRTMYTDAKTRQNEQARIEAERAELDKLRDEVKHAERDRVDREEREGRERRAQLADDERESRERIAEEERKAKEKRDAVEAESLAALEEEETRLRVERDRVDKAKREQEDEEREQKRKLNALIDAQEMLRTFRERFGHLAEFGSVVKAIDDYLAFV